MNIQKIFDALEEDNMNSAIGIICAELENQEYDIAIEDIQVTAEEIFENKIRIIRRSCRNIEFQTLERRYR